MTNENARPRPRPSRVDRLFARYRATGDPRLLARVFDKTAPELSRVAMYLTRDPDLAEDLLQSTFLTAIEDRARWDPARPVLPWLCGILANRARAARRAARERASRNAAEGEVEILGLGGREHDPAAAASQRELLDTCLDALRAFDEPYRQVLILHLEHGLRAKEIAEVLGRPAGTVRTQVTRGLELLRSALPAGFAAGALALALPAQRLGEVKAALLAEAARAATFVATAHTTAGLAGLTLGIVMTKKTLLGAAALALAISSGYLLWPDPPPATPDMAEHGSPTAEAAPAGAGPHEAPADRDAVAVEGPPPAATPKAAAERGGLLVRARYDDGTPAAAIAVAAGDARKTTDARGETLFDALDPGPVFVRAVHASGHAFANLVTGRRTEVELVLAPGLMVEGSVVDGTGRPVGGALIESDSGGQLFWPVATADADGRFALRALVRHYQLRARAHGFEPARPERFTAATADEVEVRLVLGRRGQRIAGRLCDRQGAAVPGAMVAILRTADRFPPPALHLETDADGRFWTDEAWTGAHLVTAWSGESQYRARRAIARFALADGEERTLELTLAEGATVFGVVRNEAGAGRPRERIVLRHRAADVFDLPFGDVFIDTEPDGSFKVEGLLAGDYGVEVGPSGARLESRIHLDDGEELRFDPILDTARDLLLLVVDGRDQPLAGWRVSLLNRFGFPTLSTPTGTDGRCKFDHVANEPQRVWLSAPLPGTAASDAVEHERVPTFEPPPLLPGEEHVVRVPDDLRPTAFVRGRVVDKDGRPIAASRVEVYRAGDNRIGHDLPIDEATGAFALGPISPASFDVYARAKGRAVRVVRAGPLAPQQDLDLGDIVLAEPTWVRARVRGKPAGKVFVHLERAADGTGGGGDPRPIALRARDGAFVSQLLNPGPFVVRLSGERILPARVSVEVKEVGATEVELDAREGAPQEILLDLPPDNPDRTAWAGTLVARDAQSGEVVLREKVDTAFEPEVVLRRALPEGRYELEVVDWQQKRGTATLVVAGDGPARVRVSIR